MSHCIILAADLGDLIFLLVVLVGGLVQWLTNRNKKPEDHRPEPFEDPFPRSSPGERSEPQQEPSWDELVEALGREPGELRPEQIAPPPLPTAPSTPTDTSVASPEAHVLEPLAPLSDYQKTILAALESSAPQTRSVPAAESPYEVKKDFSRGRTVLQSAAETTPSQRWLTSRTELRRAVILQEILQPPLALR